MTIRRFVVELVMVVVKIYDNDLLSFLNLHLIIIFFQLVKDVFQVFFVDIYKIYNIILSNRLLSV